MRSKIIWTVLSFCLFPSVIFSQGIHGRVTGTDPSGKQFPLPGVNIYWAGTQMATLSDAEGNFKINLSDIHYLVFSFIGYHTDTLLVTGMQEIKHEMRPKSNQLEVVDVRARQKGNYVSRLDAHAVQVVTSTELKRAACCNLSESFETNSSVDVMYADAITGAKQIQLLGLSGVYSQVISENVPLLRGMGATFGLSFIPGPWMESISVGKGAGSVRNGFESITGSINVEYKKPAASEKLFLNLFANHHGRVEANAYSAWKLNKHLSTMLMAQGATFQNRFDHNGDGFMDIPKTQNINLLNRWDYDIAGKFDSRFLIKYLQEDRVGGTMDFATHDYHPDSLTISNRTAPYGFKLDTRRLEGFWKNGLIFKNGSSMALIVSGIMHGQIGFFGESQYQGNQQSLQAQWLFESDIRGNANHHFAAGITYLHDGYTEKLDRRQYYYLYQVLGTSDLDAVADTLFGLHHTSDTTLNLGRTENCPGMYAEYTWKPIHDLTVIAGMRADHHNRYGTFYTPRLHVRYSLHDKATLRASLGKGYRTVNILSENFSLLTSQRRLHLPIAPVQEAAWNTGINASYYFKIFGRDAQVDGEIYRTWFQKQLIADLDSLPTDAFFYQLDGISYAQSYMLQLTCEPLKNLTLLTAFRMSDVRTSYNGQLRGKAMVNAYKGLISLGYATRYDKWKFDLTVQFNGRARLPLSNKMPVILQRPAYSSPYEQLMAQVTRKFKWVEVYVGGENLTNFTQKDPITEYFAPYHTHFDTSMAWGPLVGTTVYAGLRYVLK